MKITPDHQLPITLNLECIDLLEKLRYKLVGNRILSSENKLMSYDRISDTDYGYVLDDIQNENTINLIRAFDLIKERLTSTSKSRVMAARIMLSGYQPLQYYGDIHANPPKKR